MRNFLLLLILCILISGCAIGNTHRYDLGDANFDIKSDNTVAAAVVDLRPYVISGEKTPDFSGLMRGGFGNPFDITTDSGKPLAADMTASIVKSLAKAGVSAVGVTVPNGKAADVREKLIETGADRFALLLVKEWKSDTYSNTRLTYALSLQVLKQDGSVVGEKDLTGDENMGRLGLPVDVRFGIEKAFRQKIEQLFGDPEVVTALQ